MRTPKVQFHNRERSGSSPSPQKQDNKYWVIAGILGFMILGILTQPDKETQSPKPAPSQSASMSAALPTPPPPPPAPASPNYDSILKTSLKKKDYQKAIDIYGELMTKSTNKDSLLFERAKTRAKAGNKREAVEDLNKIKTPSKEVEKYYNKINPLKKRISGYCSRCCDGSFSPSCATGRGACSHHGGVCNPNEAQYEQYREF